MKLSRLHVGVDNLGNAIPGIVVILPGRRIFFRQVGDDKADRVFAPRLVAILDKALVKLGRTPPKVGLRSGYAPGERVQLSLDVEAGFAKSDGDDGGAVGGVVLAGYYPLARWLMPGIQLRGSLGEVDVASASAALRLRRPFSGDLGELSLTVDAGLTSDADATAGGQLGSAVRPIPVAGDPAAHRRALRGRQ